MPNRPITKLTLYGDSISGNCLKTKWTAEYLDVDYRLGRDQRRRGRHALGRLHADEPLGPGAR